MGADPGVVVIGAGPGGLATAAELGRRGIAAVVLERAAEPAASWRAHYDRLHLHTPRFLSHLPGLRIPAEEGRWVSRDGVVRYLDGYVEHHGINVRTAVEVTRVDRHAGAWLVRTASGDVPAAAVVVATGHNHTPDVPQWPGLAGFTGELLHAARYRNGQPYAGRDVLVVGAGNTGAEVAVDLVEHGARRVWLAVRTPPHILRRQTFGVPATLGGVVMRHLPHRVADALIEPLRRRSVPDLTAHGLPDPGPGAYARAARGEIPVLDVGLVDAVRGGRVQPVAGVAGFDGSRVLLADGSAVEPEVVIAATGYRRGLEPLVGHLGVLDRTGRPVPRGARTLPGAPGLYFVGFTNPVSGMFREIGIEAGGVARAVGEGRPPGRSGPAPGRRLSPDRGVLEPLSRPVPATAEGDEGATAAAAGVAS
ncbi:MAG TPA: NAD(P)/FAD-dependent oxidoreductase [Oryzihumus sp.]|nr:NAD(P)/FAD-dependent oxidoreductase [Oryzihumus sp.]